MRLISLLDNTPNEPTKFRRKQFRTVTNEHDKDIAKERYISPEKKQKIIDNLRLT